MFIGLAWAVEINLLTDPVEVKFGDKVIIHASMPLYDDELRYYVDVLDPSGNQIDSTLWFVREDFNYMMQTNHPEYQILRGGEFIVQVELAVNNIERTGNIVQKTSFFVSNPSPLYQVNGGVLPEDVVCNEDLTLLLKPTEFTKPACVTDKTADKLSHRGWSVVLSEDEYSD